MEISEWIGKRYKSVLNVINSTLKKDFVATNIPLFVGLNIIYNYQD